MPCTSRIWPGVAEPRPMLPPEVALLATFVNPPEPLPNNRFDPEVADAKSVPAVADVTLPEALVFKIALNILKSVKFVALTVPVTSNTSPGAAEPMPTFVPLKIKLALPVKLPPLLYCT